MTQKQSYYDIFDENDEPTGKVAGFNEVYAKGLWTHGVHIIIYTPENKVVMQKRASSLVFHPNQVEISVGGGVDAGETPEQAIIREVKEELGLTVPAARLRFIGKKKHNHHLKNRIDRSFLYSYAICMSEDELQMKADPAETKLIFLISEAKLRRALRAHRIARVGKITPMYAYWRYMLDGAFTSQQPK